MITPAHRRRISVGRSLASLDKMESDAKRFGGYYAESYAPMAAHHEKVRRLYRIHLSLEGVAAKKRPLAPMLAVARSPKTADQASTLTNAHEPDMRGPNDYKRCGLCDVMFKAYWWERMCPECAARIYQPVNARKNTAR